MKLSKEEGKTLISRLENATDENAVKNIMREYAEYDLTATYLGRAYEKMFVKEQGFSRAVTIDELQKIHHSFYTKNGGDWCRTNQGYLGKKYNIERVRKNGRIYSVKADGFNKNTTIDQAIRSDIYKSIRSQRCMILDISANIECDHKDGMKDDWRLNDKSLQKMEDFQPLSKTANDAKRQHCKKCKETGVRYDAKKLGYSESYIFGNEKTKTCVGCYWYDPQEFNKTISSNFEKLDK